MTVNRQSTHVDGHIPLCTHALNLHVLKHIGRPMSGLFNSNVDVDKRLFREKQGIIHGRQGSPPHPQGLKYFMEARSVI